MLSLIEVAEWIPLRLSFLILNSLGLNFLKRKIIELNVWISAIFSEVLPYALSSLTSRTRFSIYMIHVHRCVGVRFSFFIFNGCLFACKSAIFLSAILSFRLLLLRVFLRNTTRIDLPWYLRCGVLLKIIKADSLLMRQRRRPVFDVVVYQRTLRLLHLSRINENPPIPCLSAMGRADDFFSFIYDALLIQKVMPLHD